MDWPTMRTALAAAVATCAPLPPAAITWQGEIPASSSVITARAVLSTPDGEPFSEVVETYTNEVLAFPPPK